MDVLEKTQLLSIGEASEYLGVSIDTLRRWGKRGKVEIHRSPGGHRYFRKENLDELFGTTYERGENKVRGERLKVKEKEKEEPESADTLEQERIKAQEQGEAVQEIEKETGDQSNQQDTILKAFDRSIKPVEIPTNEPVKIKVGYQETTQEQERVVETKYHPSFSHLSHISQEKTFVSSTPINSSPPSSPPPTIDTPTPAFSHKESTNTLLPQINLNKEVEKIQKPVDLTKVEAGSGQKEAEQKVYKKSQIQKTEVKSEREINFKVIAVVLFTLAFAAFTIYLYMTKPQIISPLP